jgi:hypothetical protein
MFRQQSAASVAFDGRALPPLRSAYVAKVVSTLYSLSLMSTPRSAFINL